MNFNKEIEDLLSSDANSFDIAKLIKEEIKSYLSSLDEIFKARQGKDFLVRHTRQIDNFINIIYKCTLRQFFGSYMPLSNSLPLTLVAMGSFGREELCVYSDIDLMFVYKDFKGYNIEPIIESMLYLAWDSGLKIGHRTHKVEELFDASKEDITIKTAMLESRFICGSKYLWMETQNALNRIRRDKVKEFLCEKISLYEQRKGKHPLNMEPNIKDGAGGLRDANTLFWIANVVKNITKLQELTPKYISEKEFKELRSSIEFIFRVRSALHLEAGKKQDVLILEYIPNVAKRLGFDGAKSNINLARHTLKSLWNIKVISQVFINRISTIALYDSSNFHNLRSSYFKDGFYMYENRLCVPFGKKPWELYPLMKFFNSLEDKQIDFDISVVYFVKKSIFPSEISLKLRQQIANIFRKKYLYQFLYVLYKAGIFGRIFTPLKHTIYLPQFDGYHSYSVAYHSLKSVQNLENIKDTFIKSLYDDLCEDGKYLLRFVLLFHDCGKGKGGNHSLVGAKLFKYFAKSLHVKENMIVIGDRLIRHHTLMSNVANRQDIYSEKVIFSFLAAIKDENTLKLLYILTYCDISAVNNKTYSGFNARLLREFYDICLGYFDKNELVTEAQRRRRKEKALQNNARFKTLSSIEKKKILNIQSNLFFIKFTSNKIIDIANWAFKTKTISSKIEIDKSLTITLIRKNNINISYILEKLSFLNVLEMEIFDLFDNLKYFKIYFQDSIDENEIGYIENLIEKSMEIDVKTPKIIPTINKDDFILDCEHSKTYALMNLNTIDQKGLLAFVLYIFDKYDIKISSAKAQTVKKRTRNLFLIEKQGILCENKEKIMSLLYNHNKTKETN